MVDNKRLSDGDYVWPEKKIADSRCKIITFCDLGIMNIPEGAGGK